MKRLSDNQIIIALEGIDGSGKTTLINLLNKEFEKLSVVYKRTNKNKLLDYIVTRRFMQNHYKWQIPIYFLLSYKNYLHIYKQRKSKIILMDRCFLSNFCYFYPYALSNFRDFKRKMRLEIKLLPQKIFIIDSEPHIAHCRDNKKKSLKWMISTRENYLKSTDLKTMKGFNIEIVNKDLSIEEKRKIISDYIRGRM